MRLLYLARANTSGQYVAEITKDFVGVVQLGGNWLHAAKPLINLTNLHSADLLL
jgi:hypothetical protein